MVGSSFTPFNMKSTSLQRLLVYLVACSIVKTGWVVGIKQKRPTKSVFIDGDVVIGGLSPVHFSPRDESGLDPDAFACQGEFNIRGFEAVEAMLFTMDMLNHGSLKDIVLPNITIGMDIKETCTTADSAIRESLKFSFITNANTQQKCLSRDNQHKITPETKTIAVVGAAYSGVSMAVTNLCGLFHVPVVSYASTSRLLSNKIQFRYFFRTVPNDVLQAQVMADLVKEMNWNYVITLASDTEYGRSGIEAFKDAALRLHGYHICISVGETFTKRSDKNTFDNIFRKMKMNPKAKVVILFAELQDAHILIDKVRERGIKEKYIWIGSDAWADSKEILKSNEEVLNGMFAIVPEVRKIDKFVQYFVNFDEKRRQRNPWMTEYEDEKVAHDPAFHRQTFTHYPKVPYVMDAVLATAYALHDVLGCKSYEDCSAMKYKLPSPQFQKDYVKYLENVHFPAMSRDYMSFDKSGDAVGIYDIKHLKLVGENYEFFEVGSWGLGDCNFNSLNTSSNCLKLKKNLLDQRLSDVNVSGSDIPFSRCSPICSAGYHKVTEKEYAKCCWTCRKCSTNTVSNTTDSDECWRCPRGMWPNSYHSKCEPIEPTFLKWTDQPALIICVSIGIGVLAVFGAFIVFVFYRETPVVKASSRELSYLLLLGIMWCYVTPLFYVMEPTDTVCRIIPLATGLCPSLVVGTLLTKTNRISRIFNRKLSKSGAPACLSKKWQLLMIVCIVLVEITLCSIYTLSSDTGRNVVTFESRNELIIECKTMPDIWVAVWWAYIVGLMGTCTYQTFLSRKLPENYNEAKFITFTMLITCIVVIMFIPTYIGTSGIYRTVITCFVFIIGASAAFGCIFVPKLYIILWRPEKNVSMRPRSHSIKMGTISRGSSSALVTRLSIDQAVGSTHIQADLTARVNSVPHDKSYTQEKEQMRKHKRRSTSLALNMFTRNSTLYDGNRNDRHLSHNSVKIEKIEDVQENLFGGVHFAMHLIHGLDDTPCSSTEIGSCSNSSDVVQRLDLEESDIQDPKTKDEHRSKVAVGCINSNDVGTLTPQLSKSFSLSNLHYCVLNKLPTTCTSETNLQKSCQLSFSSGSSHSVVLQKEMERKRQSQSIKDYHCLCEEHLRSHENRRENAPQNGPEEEELVSLNTNKTISEIPPRQRNLKTSSQTKAMLRNNFKTPPSDGSAKKKLLNGLCESIAAPLTDDILSNPQKKYESCNEGTLLLNSCNHVNGNAESHNGLS